MGQAAEATTPGRIAYFKMDEAINLYGEFQHWSEENRDAKIRQMANVIDREDLYLLGGLDQNVDERMHVCYDDNAKYRPMFADAYKDYVASLDDAPDWAAVMPVQPTFIDDKTLVLLQAADMLAGEARLVPADDKPAPLREGLCPRLKVNGRYRVINEELLRELDAHMRRHTREHDGPNAWLPAGSEFSGQ